MSFDLTVRTATPTKLAPDALLDRLHAVLRRVLRQPADFVTDTSLRILGGALPVEIIPEGEVLVAAWEEHRWNSLLLSYGACSDADYDPSWKPRYYFTVTDLKGGDAFQLTMAVCMAIAAAGLLGADVIEDASGMLDLEALKQTVPVQFLMQRSVPEGLSPLDAADAFWWALPGRDHRPTPPISA